MTGFKAGAIEARLVGEVNALVKTVAPFTALMGGIIYGEASRYFSGDTIGESVNRQLFGCSPVISEHLAE